MVASASRARSGLRRSPGPPLSDVKFNDVKDEDVLEAAPGFEPGYGALQAEKRRS